MKNKTNNFKQDILNKSNEAKLIYNKMKKIRINNKNI